MSADIHCTLSDGVATLTLDNPPLNVLTVGMTELLDRLLKELAVREDVRALVVTGAGRKAFCAGSDIGEFDRYMTPGAAVTGKLWPENAMYSRLAHFPRPTIAAVHGVAFGGGLELAVCCDLIVAEETARFALPETKLGLFPGSGGTVRVMRRIGSARAKQMIFFGDPIDATTALAWGLVDRVAPDGEALAGGEALARRLAAGPDSLRLAKRAIALAEDHPEADAIARMLPLIDEASCHPDCREGVSAFREKRPPCFRP